MPEPPYKQIFKAFGEKRLASLANLGLSDKEVLDVYDWEMSLGQALLKPIGITEVLARNSIDSAISGWWDEIGLSGSWTDLRKQSDLPSILSPFVDPKSWHKRAESQSKKPKGEITHDDIIAHTTFGTWRNMIGNPLGIAKAVPKQKVQADSWYAAKKRDKECAELWKEALSSSFPYVPKGKKARRGLSPRCFIGSKISRTAALRNRVCHWDNLIRVDALERYNDMKQVVNSINPELSVWMSDKCDKTINEIITEREKFDAFKLHDSDC